MVCLKPDSLPRINISEIISSAYSLTLLSDEDKFSIYLLIIT